MTRHLHPFPVRLHPFRAFRAFQMQPSAEVVQGAYLGRDEPAERSVLRRVLDDHGAVTLVLRDGNVVERHVANLDGAAPKALEILDIDPVIFSTPRKSNLTPRRSAE